MLGAATFINPLLKVATTVAILAAIYFFIVRPILDTTEDAIDRGARVAQEAQAEARERAERVQLDVALAQFDSAITSLQTAGWAAAVKEARACRADAGNAVRAIERCVAFARKLNATVRPSRTMALSYADSLAAQGRGDDAKRVRECVSDAGLERRAVARCRALSQQLLFSP